MDISNEISVTHLISKALAEERERIASVLHNDLRQLLFAINLNVSALASKGDRSFEKARCNIQELIDEAMNCTRALSHELMELNASVSLKSAVHKLVQDQIPELNVKIDVTPEALKLSKEMEFFLIRSLQEIVHNIKKHAVATRVKISIQLENSVLVLCVRDNGIGLDSSSNADHGIGLKLISKEAKLAGGQLILSNNKEGGLRVVLRLPLN